jgi:hypothetical protein
MTDVLQQMLACVAEIEICRAHQREAKQILVGAMIGELDQVTEFERLRREVTTC